jgi:DNA-binding protein HU-beta
MADLNRPDIIKVMVAEVDGLTIGMAGASLEAVISCLSQALAEHKSISIHNFGKFGVRYRRSRLGIHPQSQSEIQIPATIVPYFTPSVGLKQMVNKINYEHHEPNSDIFG